MLTTLDGVGERPAEHLGHLGGHAGLVGDRVRGARKAVVAGRAGRQDVVGPLGFGERQVAGRQGHAEQVVGGVRRARPAAAPVVDLGKARRSSAAATASRLSSYSREVPCMEQPG